MPLLIANRRGDNSAVPPLFAALANNQKTTEVEELLKQAAAELAEDSFVNAFASFREAVTLSFRNQELEQRSRQAILFAAEKLTECHWRVAESLLHELAPGPNLAWSKLQIRKREETIRVAISESGPDFLLRCRLVKLNKLYPGDATLEARLQAMDEPVFTVALNKMPEPPVEERRMFSSRIAITEEAWNHLKTGLAATVAFLLVVLVIASNARP